LARAEEIYTEIGVTNSNRSTLPEALATIAGADKNTEEEETRLLAGAEFAREVQFYEAQEKYQNTNSIFSSLDELAAAVGLKIPKARVSWSRSRWSCTLTL
jgi:hypothetical protein